MCRSVLQLEMEEVGQKAACAHLQATLERLGAREAELKSAFVELQKKHSQIKAFSKQVVRMWVPSPLLCPSRCPLPLPLSSAPPSCCPPVVVCKSFVLHTHFGNLLPLWSPRSQSKGVYRTWCNTEPPWRGGYSSCSSRWAALPHPSPSVIVWCCPQAIVLGMFVLASC